jgi:hypothetical protein
MALLVPFAHAAAAADPDWPCPRVIAPALSLAAAWNGPAVEPYLTTWSDDPEVAALARHLSQRRVTPGQAEQEIRAFAGAAGTRRHEQLLALEAGLFTTLAAERSAVIEGLDRYGRRQKELASEVRADLEALRDPQASDPNQLHALQQKVEWETRLFEQRRQSIGVACDVPARIEQRLSVLTNIVQPLVE